MVMIMVMMPAAATGIGAVLGIKGGLDAVAVPAQALHHRLDHMVVSDADTVTQKLHR